MNDLERVERELYGDWDRYDAALADQAEAERYSRAALKKAQANESLGAAAGRDSPLACASSSAAAEPRVSPVRGVGSAQADGKPKSSGSSKVALK